MWRNWNPLNPPINHQSSEEDNYESPPDELENELVSPRRPHQSASASPRALLRPDPPQVGEVLDQVDRRLRELPTREQRAANRNAHRQAQEAAAAAVEAAAIMPVEVDFEDENGQDGEKALEYTRSLKLEWNPAQVQFWFTQLENEMYTCTVKSQWLKRCVLVKNLPPGVQSDVMSLLVLKKSEAPADVYKQIKVEILRLHAPKKEETFKKALSRVLTGLPSQLGELLINDICDKPTRLSGCCCAKAVLTLWALQLPLTVRSHIANMEFTAGTYKDVFKAADKVFLSTKATELSAGVAAITTTPTDDTAEVAAMKPKNKNQNRGTRRGSGGGGNSNNNNASSNKPQNSNSNKSSSAPNTCCSNHKKWADQAWYCLAPLTCPWKNKCVARPDKEEKK